MAKIKLINIVWFIKFKTYLTKLQRSGCSFYKEKPVISLCILRD